MAAVINQMTKCYNIQMHCVIIFIILKVFDLQWLSNAVQMQQIEQD